MNKTMKQTAMQQLLAQLKDERANLPMSKEWDRCYQAIEMAIQHTYLPMEKEQIIDAMCVAFKDGLSMGAGEITKYEDWEQYYNETYGK